MVVFDGWTMLTLTHPLNFFAVNFQFQIWENQGLKIKKTEHLRLTEGIWFSEIISKFAFQTTHFQFIYHHHFAFIINQ